ncbi:MAG: hypothetical protein IJD67_06155, partial [Clostridia bacterium]|nr:hypothetical protein [Clostridia bacterium]
IQPDKPQLRLWEYEQYRALYCGLCRSLGKHTGALFRMTLNYDYVFLAIIRSAMLGITPEIEPSRCAVHPTQKRAIAKDDKALEYCAKVSVMLTYYKLCDDIADSRGFKRLAAMAAAPICRVPVKRFAELTPLSEKISSLLKELSVLENNKCASADAPAELFGSVMSEIFAFGLEDEKNSRIASEIGRHTGRYVYLADALDDIEKDIKNNTYNPFVCMYKDSVTQVKGEIKTAVLLELRGLEAALALVDFSTCPGYKCISDNIVYLGMSDRIDKILKKLTK